jgi:hypothetical protein
LDAEFFCPIHRVNNKGLAGFFLRNLLNDSHEHGPGIDVWDALDVKLAGTVFNIQKKRVWEMAREGRFSDAFRPINNDFLGP